MSTRPIDQSATWYMPILGHKWHRVTSRSTVTGMDTIRTACSRTFVLETEGGIERIVPPGPIDRCAVCQQRLDAEMSRRRHANLRRV